MTTQVTRSGDRELVITRRFNAPRAQVFDAFTHPEWVKRWLHGPEGWTLETCEIDLQKGGAFRYQWRGDKGEVMGMSGCYLSVDRPEKTVHTEIFDEDWTDGETRVTTAYFDEGRGTRVEMTILYASREAREGAIESGMADGMEASFAALEATLIQ